MVIIEAVPLHVNDKHTPAHMYITGKGRALSLCDHHFIGIIAESVADAALVIQFYRILKTKHGVLRVPQ